MTITRNIFYISDHTGLTTENIGEVLLDQFSDIEFKRATYPFIDTVEKARSVVDIVSRATKSQGRRPIVFVSVVNNEIRQVIEETNTFQINFFDTFLSELGKELDVEATAAHHGHHSIGNTQHYDTRMEAVNFSLNYDDGANDRDLREADIILTGVSRSDRTPICLYPALQCGAHIANYPLIPDGLKSSDLPHMVKPYKDKLSDLTVQPEHLQTIRQGRRPNSTYSEIDTYRSEISDAQSIFKRHGIPLTNTTDKSVEELIVHILQAYKLKWRF